MIVGSAEPIDLLLANQRAYRDNVPVPGVIWIEDLKDRLLDEPDAAGAFTVSTRNCWTVRRIAT